jgi:hypothetical protein
MGGVAAQAREPSIALEIIGLQGNPSFISGFGLNREEAMIVRSASASFSGRTFYQYDLFLCGSAVHEACLKKDWQLVDRYTVKVNSDDVPTQYAMGFAHARMEGRERTLLVEAFFDSDTDSLASKPETLPATIRLSRLEPAPCEPTGEEGCFKFEKLLEFRLEDASFNLSETIAGLPRRLGPH